MLKIPFAKSPISSDDQSSNWEFQSKDASLNMIEELSVIPNYKDLQILKENTRVLHTQLVQKISTLKSIEKILKPEEIEELKSLDDNLFDQGEDGIEMGLYIQYVERLRKLQSIAVKIAQQVSKLQWEVDKRYCDSVEWSNQGSKDDRCTLDNVKVCTGCTVCVMF